MEIRMPGSVSDQYQGPSDLCPYVPSWCYDPPGPRMCACGHHEGYHGDDGHCVVQRWGTCKCTGFQSDRKAE
jgi:hypothetical protein